MVKCSSCNIMMCHHVMVCRQGMEAAVEYITSTTESWLPISELLCEENSQVGMILILACSWYDSSRSISIVIVQIHT